MTKESIFFMFPTSERVSIFLMGFPGLQLFVFFWCSFEDEDGYGTSVKRY